MTTRTNTASSADVDANVSMLGRILFAVPFLAFGLMHLANAGALSGLVPSWLPGGVLWVYLTGVANLAAGIAVSSGRYVREASVLLMGLLTVYILTVHVPGLFAEGSFQMALQSVLKDTGLLGGALLLFSMYD